MSINLTEAGFYDLKEHIGHKIVVVGYAKDEDFANIALECETCNTVLLDFNQPFFYVNEDGEWICSECGCECYVNDYQSNIDGEIYCSNEKCEHSISDWGSIGEPS